MGGGGKRIGAGRPTGSGKYQEPTKAIRVPKRLAEKIIDFCSKQQNTTVNKIDILDMYPGNYFNQYNNEYELPLYSSRVSAGFPSPADDHMERKLDLNDYLIKHPAATFFVRVTGNSMIKAGIYHDDILVVDRSLEPKHGKIVIAAVNGELTVKRLSKIHNKIQLLPENDEYKPIDLNEHHDIHIWGVVTSVIHHV